MGEITDPKTRRSAESSDFYDGPYGDDADQPGEDDDDDDEEIDAIFAEIKQREAAKRAEDLAAGKRTS
jgi:hypothetical protein